MWRYSGYWHSAFLSGGVMTIPFIRAQPGSDLDHVRLDALIIMNLAQLLTVPLGLLIGIVLVASRWWTRPPGYVLAAVTIVFGVVVTTQAWAMTSWAEGRPSGIGDPDGEVVLGALNVLAGAFTILLGVSIALIRWSGWESQVASARQTSSRRARRSRRKSSAHVRGHSP
ncbi:hypothetical protein FHU36_002708 [Nonomuraea muscovyensis]|uniref:Uncharacterized protein n=1 Tax=Nonomuraea muscovyensis TaxID=1124761 RepID=A0A7X0C3T0_9ACTN|nr:hypothetical protein [Nonomuraea muscovyensis]MBB6346199.1 hypothetical protein [Nonomuraea muscovyensis]